MRLAAKVRARAAKRRSGHAGISRIKNKKNKILGFANKIRKKMIVEKNMFNII